MFQHNNEGRNELLSIYDQESMQEIANHGCESGVCHKHIYYVDTLAFFDKYEGEILDLIHIRYGVDTLVDMFRESDADYNAYRVNCCWLFIENVAQDVVQDMENTEIAEEQMIASYMTKLDNSAQQLMSLSGVNPPNSMNLHRYSHV